MFLGCIRIIIYVQIRFNDTGLHARENHEVPKLAVVGLNFLHKQLALYVLSLRISSVRCKPLLDVIPFLARLKWSCSEIYRSELISCSPT